MLLKGLVRKGCPVSQLTTLDVFGCHLDGALLSKMLGAHKQSLKQVSLRCCYMRDGKKAVRWLEIFRVLSQLDLDELVLDYLLNPRVKFCVVMCTGISEHANYWLKDDRPIRHDVEGGDDGHTGSAEFRRYYARFTESFVELGLRKLLKR